jgi:CubicO group peptidase (beta-lactamase class C family)
MKMQFRSLIKKKYILIPLAILLASSLVILYFVFFGKKLENPRDGVAAFYKFPSAPIDSTLEKIKPEEKIKFLFFCGNYNNLEFAKDKVNYNGGFYFYYNQDTNLSVLTNRTKSKNFINAINESELKYYSSDSSLFANTQLINTISDKEFFKQYFDYQINNLIDFNINALIMDFNPPINSDSVSFTFITEKFLLKLDALHKNNMLSFILLDTLPNFTDNNTAKLFKKSLQQMSDSGLCGVILTNPIDYQFIENINFDGISGLSLNNESKITNKTASYFDFFIFNNNLAPNENIIKTIVESNDKQSIHTKSAKVLRAGYWANSSEPIVDSIQQFQNLDLLKSNLTENSITILRNTKNLLPLININQKLHFVFTTDIKPLAFMNIMDEYSTDYTFGYFDKTSEKSPYIPSNANTVIVLYENTLSSDSIPQIIKDIFTNSDKQTVFINYGNITNDMATIEANALVQVYTSDATAQSFSAQLIWGGIGAGGKLASFINDTLKTGFGILTNKIRLKYAIPEDVGLYSDTLKKINSIINYAISTKVMPGCQVFIAKNGVIVYEKSFGYHDYSRQIAVKRTDMYDIASLTKICGTTLAMMKMVEQDKIKLDDEIGEYFDDTEIDYSNIKPDTIIFIDTISIFNKTDKEIEKLVENKDTIHLNDTLVELTEIVITRLTPDLNIFKVPVRALLIHQSGINPSLPILPYMFYKDTYAKLLREERDENDLIQALIAADTIEVDTSIYFTPEEAFNCFYSEIWIKDSAEVKIADRMYFRKRWTDSLYKDIKRLNAYPRRIFQYTDINMILAAMVIDSVNDKHINEYLYEEFYKILGLKNTGYNPLDYFPRSKITPTESETFWRRQVIRGTVHDPSAAMLGGISGNAGLFSCASELGIIGQMWLNGGSYGGIRYLNPGTINMFAAKQPESNRGLGFDKAAIRNLNAPSAPASTYGHTGFTGCVMWVDPENDIVYVFLSNRLHPDINNWTILGQRVLQNVHQVVYDSMMEQ